MPLFATDADGDTLRYTLGGTDAALFHTYAFVTHLDYTTPGVQLTTRGGSLYDGTKSSYTVTVTASDGNGGSDTITVTVTVTDVAETPTNRAPDLHCPCQLPPLALLQRIRHQVHTLALPSQLQMPTTTPLLTPSVAPMRHRLELMLQQGS